MKTLAAIILTLVISASAHAGDWIGVAMGWSAPNYTGRLGLYTTSGGETSRQVMARALSNCRAKGRWNCDLRGAYKGCCLSIVRGEDDTYGGSTELNEFKFAAAATLDEADRKAMKHCRADILLRDCRIVPSKLRKCR